jgi:biopolymer transport protein ExbD
MYRSTLLVMALGMVLAATSGVSKAQQIHLPPSVSQSQSMGGMPTTTGDPVQKQQAIAANQQRQVEIRRDTDKMAELTQQLKEYLSKNDQVMSLDAIKKVEQIEKLAHNVKGKMKQSY